MGITVVYPAYNEQANIRRTVEDSLAVLGDLFDRFEILIVDDASTDSTGAIADRLAAHLDGVRVIHNPRNLGQGASIVAGFAAAREDWVLHNGMDYPFDLRDLGKMIPLLETGDIVVAARRRRPGYTLYRKLLSQANRVVLRTLFGVRLRDYNFVQIYRKRVWDALGIQARSTAFLTPEALIRAHDLGYRIREVEVEYHPRIHGVATAGSVRVLASSIRDLLRFWWKRRSGRKGD